MGQPAGRGLLTPPHLTERLHQTAVDFAGSKQKAAVQPWQTLLAASRQLLCSPSHSRLQE